MAFKLSATLFPSDTLKLVALANGKSVFARFKLPRDPERLLCLPRRLLPLMDEELSPIPDDFPLAL
jgi:hypothetical protein